MDLQEFRDQVVDVPPLALVLVNLIPLAGVVWLGWDVGGLLLLYWAENLIIGASALVKMLSKAPIAGLFTGAFFVIHYGGFCAVHGMLILAMTGTGDAQQLMDFEQSWPFVFVFLELLYNVAAFAYQNAPRWWDVAFAALLASHGISLVVNYFVRDERSGANVVRSMGSPYGRIILLHFTLILGGFATIALGSPLAMLLLLVVLKTGVDLVFHLREHNKARAAATLERLP